MGRGILPPRQPLSFSDEPEGCLIQGGFVFFFLSLVHLPSLREQALRTFSPFHFLLL